MRNVIRLTFLAVLVIAGIVSVPPTTSRAAVVSSPNQELKDMGAAPELSNTVWLNTDKPLHLADFRGQVVLLDFWTVDCINCYHTQPYLCDAYARLNGKGVQIIGIHYPETSWEHDVTYVKTYMQKNDLRFPSAIDNDGATWGAYQMGAWPGFVLVDKNGHRRALIYGEGNDSLIESAIKELLAEPGPALATDASTTSGHTDVPQWFAAFVRGLLAGK